MLVTFNKWNLSFSIKYQYIPRKLFLSTMTLWQDHIRPNYVSHINILQGLQFRTVWFYLFIYLKYNLNSHGCCYLLSYLNTVFTVCSNSGNSGSKNWSGDIAYYSPIQQGAALHQLLQPHDCLQLLLRTNTIYDAKRVYV